MAAERVTFQLKDILPPTATEGLTRIQEDWDRKSIEEKRLPYGRVLFFRRKRGAAGSNSTLEPEQRQFLKKTDTANHMYTEPPSNHPDEKITHPSGYRNESFLDQIDKIIDRITVPTPKKYKPENPAPVAVELTRPSEEIQKRIDQLKGMGSISVRVFLRDLDQNRRYMHVAKLRQKGVFKENKGRTGGYSVEAAIKRAVTQLEAPLPPAPPTYQQEFVVWLRDNRKKFEEYGPTRAQVPENPPLSYLRLTEGAVPDVDWIIPDGIEELIPPSPESPRSNEPYAGRSAGLSVGSGRFRGRGRGSGGPSLPEGPIKAPTITTAVGTKLR